MLLLAFLFGLVAGLRTMTGVGVWFLMLGNGIWRILLPIAAVGEYFADISPKIPPRTAIFPSVIFRSLMGGVGGWLVATRAGVSIPLPIVLGVVGALIGTYGGYNVRMWLIARIGNIPAALVEDLVAIAIAWRVVVSL
jgi:uncharacterized membrane protein